MILPLLVFLVVLISVLVSFKREHFSTTTASTNPQVTTQTTSQDSKSHDEKNVPNNTYISFWLIILQENILR